VPNREAAAAASCDEWLALQWSVCFLKLLSHVSVGAGLKIGLGPRVNSRLGLRLGLGYRVQPLQQLLVAGGWALNGLFGS